MTCTSTEASDLRVADSLRPGTLDAGQIQAPALSRGIANPSVSSQNSQKLTLAALAEAEK